MILMSRIKLFFVLGFLCYLLIACESPRVYTREDFIDRALELATFLTDNYKEEDFISNQDSLLFSTETGDTITFFVIGNRMLELVFQSAWDEGDSFDTIHCGYALSTKLGTKDENQYVYVQIRHSPPGFVTKDIWSDIFAELRCPNGTQFYMAETDSYAAYEWKENKDTIHIVYANMTCTLKKNIGIVKFTCDEHSFELVQ